MPQNFNDEKNLKPDISTEPLFKSKIVEVKETSLYSNQNEKTDVESEVLFKPQEVSPKKVELVEEILEFLEPTKPVLVNEEVLFTEPAINPQVESEVLEGEELISAILVDELTSTLNDNQVDLGDNQTQKVIKKSFVEKIFLADPIVLERYTEIKNFMLTFKEVKSRISNTADTFNIGRVQLIKLAVSGKSLKLYLNLDYDKVETRLKCKDASMKKAYSQVPVFLRIRSPRSMRNARYLLNQLVEKHNLQKRRKIVAVDTVALLKSKQK